MSQNEYTLLWQDDFDSDSLDLTRWTREVRPAGWTNHELQSYQDSTATAFVLDGCLVLKAHKIVHPDGSVEYISGKVNSQHKGDFQYGRVEVSAKVPAGQGLWPAIWMMPTQESHYGQWPRCGEIDILEVLGHDTSTVYATIHYGLPHRQQQGRWQNIHPRLSDAFHTYALEWEPEEMRFYLDDTLLLRVTDWYTAQDGEPIAPYPAPFNQPFFVQMNLAVGGDWPGDPDETTDFDKAEFLIDYLRVYRKTKGD